MVDQLNAMGFTRSEALYSGKDLLPVDRNKLLWEFSDGQIGILCAVDVLNEGVDVPDVNLVVFQRVTHSRRIFVQQLGRGLRLADGKDKVVVLDFVNDIRRFAEGLHLQGEIEEDGPRRGRPEKIALGSSVTFVRANSEDLDGANFLRQWLGDAEAIAEAGEDVSVLEFPDPMLVPTR
jgi:superfamily II DNA/RNA helicase